MPNSLAGAEAPNRFAVYGNVRHDINLRQIRHKALAVFLHRRPIKIAEAVTKCEQVLIAERLVANQYH